MSQTYVYNLGSFDDSKDNKVEIERGLFFDGTGNNHRNVEIRRNIDQIKKYVL